MPDVHVPHLEKSFLKVAMEVALIATGAFLGLMGEQWREHVQHREAAQSALRLFRAELITNQKSVASVKDYHVALKARMDAYLAADQKNRRPLNMRGLQPAAFEHTAWDLALATQSLAYIDPELAFQISRIYTIQNGYDELSRGILQAMYMRPPTEDLGPFVSAATVYYGDVVLIEPRLLEAYDEVIPKINLALGDSH